MRILQVNQFHYPRGGADKYFLSLSEALAKAGHEVAVFSMEHPQNWPSPWSPYFVSRVSFNEGGIRDKAKTPGRVLYSLETRRKFAKLLRDFRPDIVHGHNIYHHLSPSFLPLIKKQGIPFVLHLHDYKMICPNHALFIRGAYCQDCRKHRYYKCLEKKCVKDSWSGSALAMLEMYYHHCFWKVYERQVDCFIAPSRFMKEKMVEFGWPSEKIEVVYNSYDPSLALSGKEETNPGEYFLYFGRLSPEKGLDTLIEAAAKSGRKIMIVGAGPSEKSLQELARKQQAPVTFGGFQQGEALYKTISRSKAVIIPSIWAENMPLTMLEALNLGKPVIAANIGGLPEIIDSGGNGLIFEPGNATSLAEKMAQLEKMDHKKLSLSAQESVRLLTPEKNTQDVLDLYQSLLQKK